MYKFTNFAYDYVDQSKMKPVYKTARSIVNFWEQYNAAVYEINDIFYTANELTYKTRVQLLIDDGFIVEI